MCYLEKSPKRKKNSNLIFFLAIKDFEKIVELNPNGNFFLDEINIGPTCFSIERLGKVAKQVSESYYFWVACQGDKSPNSVAIKKCLTGKNVFLTF